MSLLAALCVLVSTIGAEAAPLQIALRPDALVRGTRIELRDVVTTANAATLPDATLAFDLGRSPSPGYARSITADAVRLALAGTTIQCSGAAECLVRTETATIKADELLACAEAFLRKNVAPPADAQIEVQRAPFDTQVPHGRDGRELRPRFHTGTTGRGPISIDVDVLVDGKLQVVVPLTFLVRTFAQVHVLAESLQKGDVLDARHLRVERVETTSVNGRAFVDPKAFLGQVALRPLAAGSPLTARDFAAPIIVQKNSTVTIVFARGQLRAEAFGIAKNSGALGDAVQVENQTTKRVVVGRVAGPCVVQLNP